MDTILNPPSYVLGTTDAEHERLLRQAARLAPFSERLLCDAGIGPGQRVLDVGSGVGDVALLAARLVGPAGSVVGVDQDASALAKARERADAAGIENVRFIEADVAQVRTDELFDAVVGRLILQFLPDPVAALRTLAALVRPGGVIVFQEANWASFLAQAAHLPLRTLCGKLILETFHRSGARTDMELVLFRGFQEIGLAAPELRLETPIGNDAETRRWVYDLLCTVYPRFAQLGIAHEALGDLATLSDRLEAELDATNSYAACIGLVGAWSHRPARIGGS
jgi:ubiquinone/menaquinone biosynthesis C-methylase UbiE